MGYVHVRPCTHSENDVLQAESLFLSNGVLDREELELDADDAHDPEIAGRAATTLVDAQEPDSQSGRARG